MTIWFSIQELLNTKCNSKQNDDDLTIFVTSATVELRATCWL